MARTTGEAAPRVKVRKADGTRLDGRADYDVALAMDVMHHIDADRQAAQAGI